MTHALTLVGRVLRHGGARRVAMEDPGWPAHRSSLTAADLEPVRVPVDDQGIRVDLLDALDDAAVIVTPAHQYPTGAVLSPDRRNGLVAWAHARSALIIEDDYDAEYRYGTEPVSCLRACHPTTVPAPRGYARPGRDSRGAREGRARPAGAPARASCSLFRRR